MSESKEIDSITAEIVDALQRNVEKFVIDHAGIIKILVNAIKLIEIYGKENKGDVKKKIALATTEIFIENNCTDEKLKKELLLLLNRIGPSVIDSTIEFSNCFKKRISKCFSFCS